MNEFLQQLVLGLSATKESRLRDPWTVSVSISGNTEFKHLSLFLIEQKCVQRSDNDKWE